MVNGGLLEWLKKVFSFLMTIMAFHNKNVFHIHNKLIIRKPTNSYIKYNTQFAPQNILSNSDLLIDCTVCDSKIR